MYCWLCSSCLFFENCCKYTGHIIVDTTHSDACIVVVFSSQVAVLGLPCEYMCAWFAAQRSLTSAMYVCCIIPPPNPQTQVAVLGLPWE
jgi:hypothetical protein